MTKAAARIFPFWFIPHIFQRQRTRRQSILKFGLSSRRHLAFIVQAEDDHSYVASSIAYFEALRKAKVPAELHLYAGGGHGYGLRRTDQPVTRWPELAETWLKTIGMMK
jgi:acetyl esterase/lipase